VLEMCADDCVVMEEDSDRQGDGVGRNDEMQRWANLDGDVRTLEKE
jgi:hypothetical protein